MIYDIYPLNEDDEYKDVCLDAAVTNYAGETWSATVSFDKAEGVVLGTLWRFSADQTDMFTEVEQDKVPRWFRVLHDRMKPRIIEEYFAEMIEARQIIEAESQQTR